MKEIERIIKESECYKHILASEFSGWKYSMISDLAKAIEQYVSKVLKDKHDWYEKELIRTDQAHIHAEQRVIEKLKREQEQYIIKVRIDTAEKIKGNCESEAERIWIMHYIAELRKELDSVRL